MFTENLKERVRGNEPNDRAVQPTAVDIYIDRSGILCSTKLWRVFFFEIYFSFRVIHFYSEKIIFAEKKTEIPGGVIFFRIQKLTIKLSIAF